VRAAQARGEVPTGLLYLDDSAPEMHEVNGTVGRSLVDVPYEELCPGKAALEELQKEFR
jgi:2-oxoglutarate ferredoxin oxidoreductase subunit beta